MKDVRLGSYSILSTVASQSNLLRLKSITRYLRLCPPPILRLVTCPKLSRPPLLVRPTVRLFSGLPLAQQLENGRLLTALQHLGERERYIFLSKVLEEKSLSEIARTLGITYGAAAMSYHRTIKRLRDAVGGENRE